MAHISWIFIFLCAGLLSLCCQSAAQTQAITPEPSGQRETISVGELYFPEKYVPAPEGIDFYLHMQGSARVAQQQFDVSKRSGVLVSVVLPGLSNAYREHFKDLNTFWKMLDEVKARFKRADGSLPEIRSVTILSFSAGFGAVREFLKDKAIYQRIDSLVMLDSIHAGYVDDDLTARKIPDDQMAGFTAFARDAAAGKKRMIVSHSEVKPPNYASTTETARYLLEAVDGKIESVRETWTPKLILTSRFEKGKLKILGFAGDTGADHMQHLYEISRFLGQL